MTARRTAPTLTELRSQRDEILRIAEARGAFNVRVFGSVARGQARSGSDVDFVVDFEPERTVLDLSGLVVDLEDRLGMEVDVVELWRPSRFAERVKREAVPL